MKCLALIVLVAFVGAAPVPAADPAKASKEELVKLLWSDNVWQRREAARLLSGKLTAQDRKMVENLAALTGPKARTMKPAPSLHTRLAALDVLHASGTLSEKTLNDAARDEAAEVRVWAARFTGERGDASKAALKRLEQLAADAEPTVRAAVAAALRQFTGGSLTVNVSSRPDPGRATLPRSRDPKEASARQEPRATEELLPHFKALVSRSSVEGDLYYPHIVWMAMEPRVAADPQAFFPLVGANENSVSAYCMHRVMRRVCDLSDAAGREKHLNAAMEWLGSLADKTQLASAALDGLLIAYKSRTAPPTLNMEPIFAKLSANPKLTDKTRQLATLMGDKSAAKMLIATINDARVPVAERIKAIQAARETKSDAARTELLKLLQSPLTPALPPSEGEKEKAAQSLYVESLRALGAFGGDDIGYAMTAAWKNFSPATRRTAADVLVTRSKWSRALIAGVDQKSISPLDVSATARRALALSEDATVRDNANHLLGTYRASGGDKLKLIADKKKVILSGEPDLKAGQEIARKACLVCHKFHGEGMEVGPDLTGVGRSTLDALLHNVIDPNEVIGNGFETTAIETKDGRSLTGRVVEETDTRIKLLATGGVETVVLRNEIAEENGKPAIRKLQSSLMPEGLEQMPDADFRNLIWFILNPPQDQRPWTPALRRELLGDENTGPGAKKNASAK